MVFCSKTLNKFSLGNFEGYIDIYCWAGDVAQLQSA